MQRQMKTKMNCNSKCKFCQMPEGAPSVGPGRRKGTIHINREGLCGPCATLLNKVKYQPEKVDKETMEQFVANCAWNLEHGYFVPVAQRRRLRAGLPWTCKGCKRAEDLSVGLTRDKHYTNYCVVCADEIRRERVRALPKHYNKRCPSTTTSSDK